MKVPSLVLALILIFTSALYAATANPDTPSVYVSWHLKTSAHDDVAVGLNTTENPKVLLSVNSSSAVLTQKEAKQLVKTLQAAIEVSQLENVDL